MSSFEQRSSSTAAIMITVTRIIRFLLIVGIVYVALEPGLNRQDTFIVAVVGLLVGFVPLAQTEIQALFRAE